MQSLAPTQVLFVSNVKVQNPILRWTVLFFEVSDLPAALEAIGRDKIIQSEPEGTGRPGWVVIHDPEGHNILLLPSQK